MLDEVDGDRFQLTPLGRLLISSAPNSLRPIVVMNAEVQYAAWGSLLDAVRTGSPAFEHAHGAPLFEFLAAHPDVQAAFDAAMAANFNARPSRIAEVVDFSRRRLLVDVGGGNGSLSAAVLRAHPQMRAIIFDQPHVLEAADAYLTSAGVRERCELVAGSFFESVPAGGDVYLLSRIVHDWEDERAVRVLRNCRERMSGDAMLLVVETVLEEHGNPTPAVLADVNMLAMLPGRERTESEFRELLSAAGLRLESVIELSSWDGQRALEALPA